MISMFYTSYHSDYITGAFYTHTPYVSPRASARSGGRGCRTLRLRGIWTIWRRSARVGGVSCWRSGGIMHTCTLVGCGRIHHATTHRLGGCPRGIERLKHATSLHCTLADVECRRGAHTEEDQYAKEAQHSEDLLQAACRRHLWLFEGTARERHARTQAHTRVRGASQVGRLRESRTCS